MLLEVLKKSGFGALLIISAGLIVIMGGFLVAKAPIVVFLFLLGYSAYFIGDMLLD